MNAGPIFRFLATFGIRRDLAAKPPFRSLSRTLCQRNILPLELLMGAALDTTFNAEFPGASFRYRVTPGDGLGARLYWQDWQHWEPYVVPEFGRLARHSSRIIDVGAHTGVYSLFACALNPSAEIYSFEPFPPIYSRLVANLKENGFDARSKTFQSAVSRVAGTARFHVAEDPTMNSLVDSQGELEVPVTTLDSIVPMDGRTHFVKIDVEGHEDKVLQGMSNLIEDSHPAIIFECNPGGPGRQIEDILRHHGYRLFSLVNGERAEIDELVPERFPDHNHNFLAVHPLRQFS